MTKDERDKQRVRESTPNLPAIRQNYVLAVITTGFDLRSLAARRQLAAK